MFHYTASPFTISHSRFYSSIATHKQGTKWDITSGKALFRTARVALIGGRRVVPEKISTLSAPSLQRFCGPCAAVSRNRVPVFGGGYGRSRLLPHRFWADHAVGGVYGSIQRAPAWTLWLLRAQIGIVYFYAGLAKLNADWLQGEPMRGWLASRTHFPIIGGYFNDSCLFL